MALDQYSPLEWKSVASVVAKDSENSSGGFDCNICLEFANDPVVTLCGHLYCWPCIYKWVHFQNASMDSIQHPQCPVCKSEISETMVVPLYVHGKTSSELEPEDKMSNLGITVPPRPPACNSRALTTISHLQHHTPYENQQYFSEETSDTNMGVCNSTIGVFGEMVYARVFGNSESLYVYPNSYHSVGNSSPRLRRQQMVADKCMNRVSTFLFCCLLLCLFLF